MPAKALNAPMRVPLYTPLETRTAAAPFTKDARLYNGYAELDAVTKTYRIFKRPGLGPPFFSSGQQVPGLGMYTDAGANNLWIIFGNTLYFSAPPLSSMPASVMTVDASAPYFFETVGLSSPVQRFVVFANGVKAYFGRLDTGAPFHLQQFVPITDPNYPAATAFGFAYLNGFLYVMDTNGNIFGTQNQFDPTVWAALDVVPASSNADFGIALTKQLNYVIALKQYTTQVFFDAGNPPPGSPLGAVPDAQIPLGCLAGTSVQEIDNSVLWLTANETSSPQIVQMDNLVPKIVSTPSVERILDNITWNTNNFQNANYIRSWVLKHAGHRFYGITLLSNNITLIYDLDQNGWYIWTDPNGNFWPIVSMAYQAPLLNQQGIHFGQGATNGTIYPVDGDYAFPSDNGVLFPVDVYTANFDAGIDRVKMINMLRVNADQTHGSMLSVRYSDDDYQSWSNFRTIDLSLERPVLPSGGTFRRRAYHFRHLANTTLRLHTVDAQFDIGVL